MRKCFVILFLILCPYLVFADSAGPSIIGYDAVITNKNGAKISGDEIIPYNTKIHVYDEYDDGMVGACYIEYAKDCYSADERFDIYFKDIAVLKEEIVPEDLLKLDNGGTVLDTVNSKLIIHEKDGIKLSKGPAEAYGFYDKKIPYKTILNFKYAIRRSVPGGSSIGWIYVNENGYRGWIEGDIPILLSSSALTFSDITIRDGNNNPIKIPAETVLDTVYFGNSKSFVNYKGTLGEIKTEDLSIGYKSELGYVLTTKSTEIKSNGKTLTAIPTGEKIKIIYANRDDKYSDNENHSTGAVWINYEDDIGYYYVEYNGTKGFVSSNDVISLYYEYKTKNTTFDHDLTLYSADYYLANDLYEEGVTLESYSKKYETGKTVPANSNVTVYMIESLGEYNTNRHYSISLIKYKNNVGWVIDEVYSGDENDNSETAEFETEDDNKNKDRVFTIIVYSLMAAGILSLTAYVTILFINKNKKKTIKKEEVVKDKKEKKEK